MGVASGVGAFAGGAVTTRDFGGAAGFAARRTILLTTFFATRVGLAFFSAVFATFFATFFLLTAFAAFLGFFFRPALGFFALAFEDLGAAFLCFFGIPGRLEKSKDHYPRR